MSIIFSIVVPVYNAEKFLNETINSVIKQTYKCWELLLIDDGSTDNSKNLISEYLYDERIKLISKSNGGQGSARNLGIISAKGRYICFLDADDVWLEHKLEIQHKFLMEHPEVDFLYTLGANLFDKDNTVVPYIWHTGNFTGKDFFEILINSNAVNTDTVVIKREIFDLFGCFDEAHNLRGSEDFDLWMRLAYNDCVITGLSDITAYYRIHGNGEHDDKYRQWKGKLLVFEKYYWNVNTKLKKLILKNVRYFSRELLMEIDRKRQYEKVSEVIRSLSKFDNKGLITNVQLVMLYLFSPRIILLASKVFLFRIGYRIEQIILK